MKREVEVSTEVGVLFDRVREILVDDPGVMVAEQPTAVERRARAFRTTLHVGIGSGGGAEHDVVLQLGVGRVTEAALAIPVSWRAVGRHRAFPTFDGELEAIGEGGGARVVLRGTYRPPLGLLGGLGDRLAGRRLARQSLVSFVEHAAGRLVKEARRRADAAPPSAPPYPLDLRER